MALVAVLHEDWPDLRFEEFRGIGCRPRGERGNGSPDQRRQCEGQTHGDFSNRQARREGMPSRRVGRGTVSLLLFLRDDLLDRELLAGAVEPLFELVLHERIEVALAVE